MVVLDTDHVSLLEWVTSPERDRLVKRLEQLDAKEIATTIITYEEQTRANHASGKLAPRGPLRQCSRLLPPRYASPRRQAVQDARVRGRHERNVHIRNRRVARQLEGAPGKVFGRDAIMMEPNDFER